MIDTLVNARISLGLTQLDIAERTKMSLSSIQAYEQGRTEITLNGFIKYAAVVKHSVFTMPNSEMLDKTEEDVDILINDYIDQLKSIKKLIKITKLFVK